MQQYAFVKSVIVLPPSLYAQVNPSTVDWPLHADMTNSQFVGPSVITARALSTTCYPLTFSPQMEGDIEVSCCFFKV